MSRKSNENDNENNLGYQTNTFASSLDHMQYGNPSSSSHYPFLTPNSSNLHFQYPTNVLSSNANNQLSSSSSSFHPHTQRQPTTSLSSSSLPHTQRQSSTSSSSSSHSHITRSGSQRNELPHDLYPHHESMLLNRPLINPRPWNGKITPPPSPKRNPNVAAAPPVNHQQSQPQGAAVAAPIHREKMYKNVSGNLINPADETEAAFMIQNKMNQVLSNKQEVLLVNIYFEQIKSVKIAGLLLEMAKRKYKMFETNAQCVTNRSLKDIRKEHDFTDKDAYERVKNLKANDLDSFSWTQQGPPQWYWQFTRTRTAGRFEVWDIGTTNSPGENKNKEYYPVSEKKKILQDIKWFNLEILKMKRIENNKENVCYNLVTRILNCYKKQMKVGENFTDYVIKEYANILSNFQNATKEKLNVEKIIKNFKTKVNVIESGEKNIDKNLSSFTKTFYPDENAMARMTPNEKKTYEEVFAKHEQDNLVIDQFVIYSNKHFQLISEDDKNIWKVLLQINESYVFSEIRRWTVPICYISYVTKLDQEIQYYTNFRDSNSIIKNIFSKIFHPSKNGASFYVDSDTITMYNMSRRSESTIGPGDLLNIKSNIIEQHGQPILMNIDNNLTNSNDEHTSPVPARRQSSRRYPAQASSHMSVQSVQAAAQAATSLYNAAPQLPVGSGVATPSIHHFSAKLDIENDLNALCISSSKRNSGKKKESNYSSQRNAPYEFI
jgi:hypothetical protein